MLPTAEAVAQRELSEAKRELLKAQTGLDYAKAMVRYNEDRVARLQQYLGIQPYTGEERNVNPS